MLVYEVHYVVSACCYVVCLQIEMVQPHNNLLCKSGTDFKNVTAITLALPVAAAAPAADGAATNGVNGHSSGSDAAAAAARPSFSWQDYLMTSDVPEDPEIQTVTADVIALLLSCATDARAQTASHGMLLLKVLTMLWMPCL
jgi:hypothetical protein